MLKIQLTQSQINFLEYYKINNKKSLRDIAKDLNISHENVRKKLKQLYQLGCLNLINGEFKIKEGITYD